MKSDIERADEIMKKFQTDLYNVCQAHISPTEVTTSYMVAGIMMKTAIQIYASTMDEKSIIGLMEEIKNTVPSLVDDIHREFSDVTVH